MNIAEVVSGRAKLKGIRRALLSVAARNLLADQLRALLPAEAVVGPLRIREAQFKPGRKRTTTRRYTPRERRPLAFGPSP